MSSEATLNTGGEVVTFAVGTYSNHVTSHLFNLQYPERGISDADPNILWTRGRNGGGKSVWTPRLLTFDLKENYISSKFLQSKLVGSEDATTQSLWEGPVKRVELQDNVKSGSSKTVTENHHNRRTPTSESSNTWIDYADWDLNTSVTSDFPIYTSMRNANVDSLQNYGQGLQCYSLLEDHSTESIRRYVEPCDYFQGFQLFVDQDDGFSGIASRIMEHISDEYEKKTTMCYGTTRPIYQNLASDENIGFKLKLTNTALTWNSFCLNSSVFTCIGLTNSLLSRTSHPTEVPYMSYNPESDYESSYLLAAAIDTFISPFTLKENRVPYSEVSALLSSYGHKMTILGSAFPYLFPNHSTLFGTLRGDGLDQLTSLLPGTAIDCSKSIGNYFALRGFLQDEIIRKDKLTPEELYRLPRIKDASSCLEAYCEETYSRSVNVIRSGVSPFKVSEPFSSLAGGSSLNYLVSKHDRSHGDLGGRDSFCVRSIASAHNSPLVGDLLKKFIQVESSPQQSFVSSRTTAACIAEVEQDDYTEAINNLKCLSESYDLSKLY